MFYPFLEFKFLKYYLPFGFIGLYRWSIILIRLYISRKYYRPISGEPLLCTTTIVAPVYNEPLQSFEEALQSWIKNNPTEIILVIDQSSTDCIFLASSAIFSNIAEIVRICFPSDSCCFTISTGFSNSSSIFSRIYLGLGVFLG